MTVWHLSSSAWSSTSAGGTSGRGAGDEHDEDDDERGTEAERGQHQRQVGVQQPATVVGVVGRESPVLVGDRLVDDDDHVDVWGARRLAVVASRHAQRELGVNDRWQIGRRR